MQLALRTYADDRMTFKASQQAYNERTQEIHRFGIRNPYMDIEKHSGIAEIHEKWDERQDDFTKRRKQEEKALSLDDRRIIFENYFTLSYREEDPRKSAFME